MTEHPPEDRTNEIQAFWDDAKVRITLNQLPFYLGDSPLASLRPPAWSFGTNPEQADELLALVLDGVKTATSSAVRDYQGDDEPMPTVGSMSILTDGAGHPRALITTTDVRTVPFGDVDEEHARDEGEGDLSLAYWREVHRTFFTETGQGAEVPDDLPVILERFVVVYVP